MFVTPMRKRSSHKGQNGKALLVGGSRDYTGALALAGIAALRSGCDIVTIAAPEKVAWAINAQSPDLITRKMEGDVLAVAHFPAIRKLCEKHDVLAFGNGMGTDRGTAALCRRLAGLDMPKVIDADGIKALRASDCRNAILTPNHKELGIFLRNSGVRGTNGLLEVNPTTTVIRNELREFFDRGNVLLIKGPTDIIISAKGIKRIKGGNPGLTKAGTGDVLAGLCAGYLAQLKDPVQTVENASIMNKRIGDLLKKRHRGYTYLASDMVEEMRKQS